LEKWTNEKISGTSAIFGLLAFQAHAIREMEFNLDRPKDEGVAGAAKEFEDLDE